MIYKMFEAIAHSTIDTVTTITHVAIVVCLIGILLIVPVMILLCYANEPVMWVLLALAVFLGLCKKPKPSPSADD